MNNSPEPAAPETSLPQGRMHRREFLIGGARIGLSFLALDALALPAFAQTTGAGPQEKDFSLTRPPANLDDSLNIMAAFLAKYQPPTQRLPASGAWRASYDLLEWGGSIRPFNPESKLLYEPRWTASYVRSNRVIGHLSAIRQPGASPGKVGYNVEYDIYLIAGYEIYPKGFLSTFRASMQCLVDILPCLKEWNLEYENHAAKTPGTAAGLSEQGSYENGILQLRSGAGVRRIATDRPVVPQWAVMDALCAPGAADSVTKVEFDLFQDLTSYRPRQRLRPCGLLEMSLSGTTSKLHGFVQTGSGSEPIHYWLDAEGRPLLFTGGLLSAALTSIEPV